MLSLGDKPSAGTARRTRVRPRASRALNNEGVRIDAIVKDLLAQLATRPKGPR